MRVLFAGDIVGPEAAHWLARRLPGLRRERGLDLVVVNAENCAVTGPSPMNGFGMTTELVEHLLSNGVDVITGGNHSWDGPEAAEVLANPNVVRPHNVPAGAPGKGVLSVHVGGEIVTVVNLLSRTARLRGQLAPDPSPIYPAWCALRDSGLPGTILIDLHGDSSWEKASFAAALDGEVAAVLGTHTHDPTARCHLLPRGTAFVAEVGMTGRLGWTGGGFNPAHFAASLKGEDPDGLPPYDLCTGPMTLGAVVLDIENTRTLAAERIT